MVATLIDFYINVVALFVWIAYKESNWMSALLWIIFIVCFGRHGLFFAVKEVSLLDEGSQGKQSIVQLEQEISLLSQFKHYNIVRYLGTDTGDGNQIERHQILQRDTILDGTRGC
ncbi:hypothetical protein L2E82_18507 [Cichorium intybus]|uniref:Uncharacterized protein n=1 Tax=Cichorium intybus TaxID=13427 RepID=A0ACB9FAA7_CICIN|nr:hypothetical protein L2E82_18507 [Cichorium intybus]